MKILVTYFSQTGNTEKIATAIYEEVSVENDTKLKKIDEVNPGSLNEYDLIFIGTPIHTGSISNVVKEFIGKIPSSTKIKLAGFITHSAPTYPRQTLEEMTMPFVELCEDKEIIYQGCYNCQGYLAEILHDSVRKRRGFGDEEWKETVNQMTGHPNTDDKAEAKRFAMSVITSDG